MKIKINPEMEAFFSRCEYNMQNNLVNDYIGVIVEPQDEYALQLELRDIGVHDFQTAEEKWPSLYISTDEYQKTPYNSTIRLNEINSNGFTYDYEEMPAYELFNVSLVQRDPEMELNDSLVLRAFDKPYKAAILRQDGNFWMTDTPAEANTINPCAQKAHGKVLTFGLGIGYFVFMALLNPAVESVTIIEQSSEVINMFKKHLLPQFPRNNCIEIIQGDAFDYFNQAYLDNYDYVFVDIWKSNDDGYLMIEKMLEAYLPSFDKVDFWIEDSCFEILSGMIFVYFFYLAQEQLVEHDDPEIAKIYQKIDKYFSKINKTITSVAEVKAYMYDRKVYREIVSINL